jgi:hypothetical protein
MRACLNNYYTVLSLLNSTKSLFKWHDDDVKPGTEDIGIKAYFYIR